jgi:hypothetical protein
MPKFPEFHPKRPQLGESTRKCDCGKMMKCINFSSQPIGDQVWMDWKCECGIKLKLRYFDDWLEKRIEVTER